MEFKFNVNEIFKQPIVELNQSLIPPGYNGDRRGLWDAVSKVSEVVNAIGAASAAAQGLNKAITSADRLRNSEHKLYLLIDNNTQNGKGVITGMLKTGKKSLYVFDRDGHHFQVQPPCILDFYVHESRQRSGLGKHLFEHMLQKESIEPVKLAIDRPSDKFLGFLNKHYSLHNGIKQMNNYVVFDGFFPERLDKSAEPAENNNSSTPVKTKSANGLQNSYTSPYGRYGAPRPPCSMGQIIHNQSSTVTQPNEPTGVSLNIRPQTSRPTSGVWSENQPVQSQPASQVNVSSPAQIPNQQMNQPPSAYAQHPNQEYVAQYMQAQHVLPPQVVAQPQAVTLQYAPQQVPPTQQQYAPVYDANNQPAAGQNRASEPNVANLLIQGNAGQQPPQRLYKIQGSYSSSYPNSYSNHQLISPIMNMPVDSQNTPRLQMQQMQDSQSPRPIVHITPPRPTQRPGPQDILELLQQHPPDLVEQNYQVHVKDQFEQRKTKQQAAVVHPPQHRKQLEYTPLPIGEEPQQYQQNSFAQKPAQFSRPQTPKQYAQPQAPQQYAQPPTQQQYVQPQSRQQYVQPQSQQQNTQSPAQQQNTQSPTQQQYLQQQNAQSPTQQQYLQQQNAQPSAQQQYLQQQNAQPPAQQQYLQQQNAQPPAQQQYLQPQSQQQNAQPPTQQQYLQPQSQQQYTQPQPQQQFVQPPQQQYAQPPSQQQNIQSPTQQQYAQAVSQQQQYAQPQSRPQSGLLQSRQQNAQPQSRPQSAQRQMQQQYAQPQGAQQSHSQSRIPSEVPQQYTQQQPPDVARPQSRTNVSGNQQNIQATPQQQSAPQAVQSGTMQNAQHQQQQQMNSAPVIQAQMVGGGTQIGQNPKLNAYQYYDSNSQTMQIGQPTVNASASKVWKSNESPNASGDMQPAQKTAVPASDPQNYQQVAGNAPKYEAPAAYSPPQNTRSQVKLSPILEQPNAEIQMTEHQVNENAKLERPNSLSIQQSEELESEHIVALEGIKSQVQQLKGEIDNTEEAAENPQVSETSAKLSEMKVSKGEETPTKKTPSHLTDQGFFDLKFYHNKLW